MRLALAQINARVGAVLQNERRVLAALDEARRQGAEVVLFPECALVGYPARDLLYDDGLVARAEEAASRIARAAPDLTVVLGSVERAVDAGPERRPASEASCRREGPRIGVRGGAPKVTTPGGRPLRRNVALVLERGAVRGRRAKSLLPDYDVFSEPRWFVPGGENLPLTLAGTRTGLLVCEDLWEEEYARKPASSLVAAGAELLLALNASPFRVGVHEERRRRARCPGVAVAYVNAIGGEDELVFDGGSFVVDAKGNVLLELPRFEEAVATIDLARPAPRDALPPPPRGGEEELFRALALGLRDFVRKNGQSSVWLGLSGGVDSALVACLAREALGPERVHAVALPSRHNDPRSTDDARVLARNLGIDFRVVPIEGLHAAAENELGSLLAGTSGENAQARLRMLVLMAHVNARGGLLLNTSNKTELALGYGTLHGDLAGTLAPIADLTKTQVYAVARWYDARTGAIPRFILERPPSAELAPGQVDPFDYDVVAPLVEELVEGATPEGLIARGLPADEVLRCVRLFHAGEHKRRQGPIGLKVSRTAFGTGRQVPVTRPKEETRLVPAKA
jgi:NAD+ synthase (glutamine-hydrolysing)